MIEVLKKKRMVKDSRQTKKNRHEQKVQEREQDYQGRDKQIAMANQLEKTRETHENKKKLTMKLRRTD